MRSPSARGGAEKKAEATPCCTKLGLKRGPWTAEEDELLADHIKREGEGRWRTLPKKAGLLRCGKSCRLRWMNYLRPSVKRGHITADEEELILRLHRLLGNRWSLIAGRIPGRTDNEIKNYWNSHLSKKLINQGIDPKTHMPFNPNPSIHDYSSSTYLPLSGCHQNVIIKNHNYLLEDAPNIDLQHHSTNYEDEDHEMINCCNDEEFSSFFDSLINDDIFDNQNQD